MFAGANEIAAPNVLFEYNIIKNLPALTSRFLVLIGS